jgi:hypothetical protein
MFGVVEWCALALLTGTALGTYVPQLVRTKRLHDANGLSPTALLFTLACYGGWYLYLGLGGAWGMFAANALGSVVVVMLVWAAANAGLSYARAWPVPVAFSVACALAAAIDYTLLGLVLTAMSFVSWAPKVHAAWTSPLISGISVGTWFMVVGSGVSYLTLGLMGRPFAVLMVGISALLAAGLVLAAVLVRSEARHPTGVVGDPLPDRATIP